MQVLVTGGAGYVGSVSVAAILEAGHEVVVLDDLTTGHRGALVNGAALRRAPTPIASWSGAAGGRADRRDPALRCALPRRGVRREPVGYYRENVAGGVALLEAAREAGVDRLVFSSTAAVYGLPDSTPITEDAPAPPDQPIRRDEAHVRRRPALVRRGVRPAERQPALLQRGRRHRRTGRGPSTRDAPDPERAAGTRPGALP